MRHGWLHGRPPTSPGIKPPSPLPSSPARASSGGMKLALSGKGGVGKTTLAALLATALARRGYATLAIDADPAPNLGPALGLPAGRGGADCPDSRGRGPRRGQDRDRLRRRLQPLVPGRGRDPGPGSDDAIRRRAARDGHGQVGRRGLHLPRGGRGAGPPPPARRGRAAGGRARPRGRARAPRPGHGRERRPPARARRRLGRLVRSRRPDPGPRARGSASRAWPSSGAGSPATVPSGPQRPARPGSTFPSLRSSPPTPPSPWPGRRAGPCPRTGPRPRSRRALLDGILAEAA